MMKRAIMLAITLLTLDNHAQQIAYVETSPGSGIFNLTLTNTNTVDNIGELHLDFSSISPTYVDDYILPNGPPLFDTGDANWEYVSSTPASLFIRAEFNHTYNYLTPNQSMTFQITHTTGYVTMGRAQAQMGTEASGNYIEDFDAPRYIYPAEICAFSAQEDGNAVMVASNLSYQATNRIEEWKDDLGWQVVTSFVSITNNQEISVPLTNDNARIRISTEY